MQRTLGRVLAVAATLAATGGIMLAAASSASATGTCVLGHCVDVTAGPSSASVTVDGVSSGYATCPDLTCGGRPSIGVSLANGTATAHVVGGPTLTAAQVAAAGHNVVVYRAFGGWIGASVDSQNIGPVRACPPVCN